jgi:hypothetical protein
MKESSDAFLIPVRITPRGLPIFLKAKVIATGLLPIAVLPVSNFIAVRLIVPICCMYVGLLGNATE